MMVNFQNQYTRLQHQQKLSTREREISGGDSPLTYLQRFRVEAAKRLIENTPESISEICYRIGYEDIAFFQRMYPLPPGYLRAMRPRQSVRRKRRRSPDTA